jgi:3-oxoacyl-[acyl-carrier protein] reductase
MPDRYAQIVNAPVMERLADLVGLPKPIRLRRWEPGQPLLEGPALVGGAKGGRLVDRAVDLLEHADVRVDRDPDTSDTAPRYAALVFDATGITESSQLVELYEFLHTTIRRLGHCGRMIVLGTPPDMVEGAAERTAQRSLEGFVRSAAKEARGGSTAMLIHVAEGAEAGLDAPLRFVLSSKSAFVDGQVITVGAPTDHAPTTPADHERPLEGKVAVVTGAARGIGESIARTLARDGATVVCLDLPAAGQALSAVANDLGRAGERAAAGTAFQLDITAPDAPERLAAHLTDRHGGVDIVVHNAGVTRDKTLAGMDDERWRKVIDINLRAQERIDDHLLDAGTLNEGGRIVCVSSMSGIAGNRGQTNYATSKAGVIGHVESLADRVAATGATINAVAPGFIETEMTDAMPFGPREVGRRISSLGQGGLPVDVAETIAFFAAPDSTWVNGTTLRVCGQNLLGA